MTEAEYNLVSNLATLRVAQTALRDVFFFEQPERYEKRRLAMGAVQELIEELYDEHNAAKERA